MFSLKVVKNVPEGLSSNSSDGGKVEELQNEVDEISERKTVTHPNSYFGTLTHLLKSIFGTGILALPNAFRNSGLIFGVVGTLFIIALCTHTGYLLVHASQTIRKRSKTGPLGYSNTCSAVFRYGPKKVQKFAVVIEHAIDILLCVGSILSNAAFIVFVAESFQEIFSYWFPTTKISLEMYILILSMFLLITVQIRQLKHLVPFSFFANVVLCVALAISLYYMFEEINNPLLLPMFASFSQLPIFFGAVFFAIDAIVIFLPLENNMKHPETFLGATGVLNIAMGIVGVVYILFGFFGYLRYGEDTEPSITLNLPINNVPTQIVHLFLPLSILVTYNLLIYVPVDIICNKWLSSKVNGNVKKNIAQVIVRCSLVGVIGGVAVAVPKLELVISLVGSVSSSTLVLLIPTAVDIILRWNNGFGYLKWRFIKNILIQIFYVFILVTSITQSLDSN